MLYTREEKKAISNLFDDLSKIHINAWPADGCSFKNEYREPIHYDDRGICTLRRDLCWYMDFRRISKGYDRYVALLSKYLEKIDKYEQALEWIRVVQQDKDIPVNELKEMFMIRRKLEFEVIEELRHRYKVYPCNY